jgi:hypothetical protein
MKNFYLKMISILFLGFIVITSYAQEWNFSSTTLGIPGTFAVTTTVEGLTIYATSTASVAIDANSKVVGEFTFTHRLKLGGTGTFDVDNITPISRVLSFPVTGNTTITIIGLSSSTTPPDRTLIIAAGDKNTVVGSFNAPASSTPNRTDFNYVGGPTTIFLFSTSSGINLYYIKAAPLVTGIIDKPVKEMKIFPNPATESVSINMNEPGEIFIYNTAGIKVKQQMATPSQNTINISDLDPGLYFVRTMNNKTAQKLIIR